MESPNRVRHETDKRKIAQILSKSRFYDRLDEHMDRIATLYEQLAKEKITTEKFLEGMEEVSRRLNLFARVHKRNLHIKMHRN